jgi:hypothetical protein
MANIFQNFGSKVGNAFTNLGQGNSLLANQSQIANLSDEDKNKLRKQGLQKFADTMFLTSAIGSGDANKIALAQNRIRQRQLDEEDAKRKAEQQEAIEKYKKDNPDKAGIIDAILGGVPASVAIPKTPPKKSKSDYIVEILEKIKIDPTYGTTANPFSTSDQNIMDVVSNTDEFTKLKRAVLGGINTQTNESSSTTNIIPTVVSEEDYKKLNNGDKFIYNGVEYTKGE